MDLLARVGPGLRRSCRRGGALLLGLGLLVALLGDTFDAHDCPHHDIFVPVAAKVAEAAGPGTADGGPSAAHMQHDRGDGHSGPCMCVGDCHGTAGSPLSPPDAASIVFEAPSCPAPLFSDGTAASASPLPYLIPYSTGPPSTLG